jgi:hypothetical protein
MTFLEFVMAALKGLRYKPIHAAPDNVRDGKRVAQPFRAAHRLDRL